MQEVQAKKILEEDQRKEEALARKEAEANLREEQKKVEVSQELQSDSEFAARPKLEDFDSKNITGLTSSEDPVSNKHDFNNEQLVELEREKTPDEGKGYIGEFSHEFVNGEIFRLFDIKRQGLITLEEMYTCAKAMGWGKMSGK